MAQPATETLDLARDTMGKDLLSALIDEIRILPKPWPALSEPAQEEIIERLRKRVRHSINEAVDIIAADDRTVIKAEVESVQFKDGVKAVLTLSKGSGGRHELADATGDVVLLVVGGGAEEYTVGMHEVKPDPSQGALKLAADGSVAAAADDVIAKAMRSMAGDEKHEIATLLEELHAAGYVAVSAEDIQAWSSEQIGKVSAYLDSLKTDEVLPEPEVLAGKFREGGE